MREKGKAKERESESAPHPDAPKVCVAGWRLGRLLWQEPFVAAGLSPPPAATATATATAAAMELMSPDANLPPH